MFPQDTYTPHGYLDNPAHGWKAGPGGVLRSRPAIGLGWYYPSYPHGYNYVWHYLAHLQLGFELPDGRWLVDGADFTAAGLNLYSDYHSKNWLSFVFETPEGLRVRAIFFLAEAWMDDGDALGCLVQIRNRGVQAQSARFMAALDYERNLGQGLDWTSGLYVRRNEGGLSVAAFQEGTALHLRGNRDATSKRLEAVSMSALADGLRGIAGQDGGEVAEGVAHKVGALDYEYRCEPGQEQTFLLVVARDVSEFRAVKRVNRLLATDALPLYESLSRGQAEDSDFWRTAPQLSGDWPDYVRRGLVYDFETLRMMVRRPMGRYKLPWDAMQLQVPRVVLAEAALDMLILSYADPTAAKAVLLGTFADAPEPNVPCSREDGSYNMVAVDGSPCGTAPEWCFPFHCIELVYRRTGDREWLGRLYPYLEAFVDWWQRNRTDEQGRPFYKCSWEAGQDNSARFGIKDDPSGGGALGEHLWPVDLQAAMAQCGWLLAAWGAELGLDAARIERWNTLGGRHAAALQKMWQPTKNGFADFDRRTGSFTDVTDTMLFAPLLCRAASVEQIAAMQSGLENPPLHGQLFAPMMWPSVAFCLIEACHEAGRDDLAARYGWEALQGVYRWLDSRPTSVKAEDGGLPGVAREYWPQVTQPAAEPPRGGGGAEVYGWGCLSAYMLLRYVVGLQEDHPLNGEPAFRLRPNLPPALLLAGKVYRVRSLPCQGLLLNLTYTVEADLSLSVIIEGLAGGSRQYRAANGETIAWPDGN